MKDDLNLQKEISPHNLSNVTQFILIINDSIELCDATQNLK